MVKTSSGESYRDLIRPIKFLYDAHCPVADLFSVLLE